VIDSHDNAAEVTMHVESLVGHREQRLREGLMRAAEVVYDWTRQRFDQWGNGDWPPLAESTVQKKTQAGYAEPDRPLYAEGNLYESVTSQSGPYSVPIQIVDNDEAQGIVISVDWEEGGWQIPTLLSVGTQQSGGNLPARPIWPPTSDPAFVDDVRSAIFGNE
jgi:hypothetical protein